MPSDSRAPPSSMLATIVGTAALFVAAPDAPHEDSAARQDSGAPYTLRIEATSSTNMDVWQVMAFDDKGINMLRNCSRVDPELPLAQQQALVVEEHEAVISHFLPALVQAALRDDAAAPPAAAADSSPGAAASAGAVLCIYQILSLSRSLALFYAHTHTHGCVYVCVCVCVYVHDIK